jgi:hypothetical protein
MLYRFQKHKAHLWEITGSAAFRAVYAGYSSHQLGYSNECGVKCPELPLALYAICILKII